MVNKIDLLKIPFTIISSSLAQSLVKKKLLDKEEFGKLSKTDALKKLKEAKEFLDLN